MNHVPPARGDAGQDVVGRAVMDAVHDLFVLRDPVRARRHAAPGFRTHSVLPAAGIGPDALEALVRALPPDFRYVPRRCLVHGDHVFVEGTCHGLADTPLTCYDLFRTHRGLLAGHGDAVGPVGLLRPASAPGRSQRIPPLPGAAALARDFVRTVLIAGDHSAADRFLADGADYHHHDPVHARELHAPPWTDGPHCCGGAVRYTRTTLAIADRQTALVRSRGVIADVPCTLYDLFHIEEGRLAEHRALVTPEGRLPTPCGPPPPP
ncbi:nuclear transport factor 2 family protein [Streptomyces sp. NPDC058486]|uniref:nuclear transport factor 2 family protein n=1 Tax=unclassified Streptomyces TaxID=2593676 RepID=UPI00364D3509